jgi:hypothetical protein
LQVIDHILGARAAVADLTGLNANVFYELGVRHTARLPTALIAEKGCDLPFDIAQMRTIFFESTNLRSADQCRRDIAAQLGQALHGGAVDSPIATSVDVRALAGGSVVERNVAEIVTSVEEIAKSQRVLMQRIDRIGRSKEDERSIEPPLRDTLEAYEMLQRLAIEQDDSSILRAVQVLGRPLRYMAKRYGLEPPVDIAISVESESESKPSATS